MALYPLGPIGDRAQRGVPYAPERILPQLTPIARGRPAKIPPVRAFPALGKNHVSAQRPSWWSLLSICERHFPDRRRESYATRWLPSQYHAEQFPGRAQSGAVLCRPCPRQRLTGDLSPGEAPLDAPARYLLIAYSRCIAPIPEPARALEQAWPDNHPFLQLSSFRARALALVDRKSTRLNSSHT